jgi:hypothetical protein
VKIIFFNIYIISALLLLLFMVVDFLINDITNDRELELKASRILFGTIVLLLPIINTLTCIYYFTMYFRKVIDIVNQDSNF